MFFEKISRFWGYPLKKKIQVIFIKIKSLIFFFPAMYLRGYLLSYLPDSFVSKKYPYHADLYGKFRKNNKINNGGDIHRLNSFILNIEYLMSEKNILGDFAELGVWRGNTSQILAYFAKKYDRHCYLFDTFKGFDKKDLINIDLQFQVGQFSNTSIDIVKENIGDEYLSHCTFISGHFPSSITDDLYSKSYSIVSIDADLYESTKSGLEYFYPLTNDGGIFLLHDYSSLVWQGCKKAIDEFCDRENQQIVVRPDKSGSAFIRIRK